MIRRSKNVYEYESKAPITGVEVKGIEESGAVILEVQEHWMLYRLLPTHPDWVK